MTRLTKTLCSLAAALVALPLAAAPSLAQEDCRGWMTSCASVEVRADDDRLLLFTPNLSVEEDAEEGQAEEAEGSDRLTVLPQELGSTPFETGTAGSYASADDHPGQRKCTKYETVGDPKSGEERDDCARPVAALFMLALPTTLYMLSPTDDGPVVTGPVSEPVAGPQGGDDDDSDSGTGSGDGGTADAGAGSDDGSSGGSGADSGGATTGETSGEGGGSSGGNSAGDSSGGSSGGSAGGSGGSTGGSTGGGNNPAGGGSAGSGGNNTGGEGDAGPYHPTAGDMPPISQVPEPISTTLFGLGLAGYAGARLRRRRGEAIQQDL